MFDAIIGAIVPVVIIILVLADGVMPATALRRLAEVIPGVG